MFDVIEEHGSCLVAKRFPAACAVYSVGARSDTAQFSGGDHGGFWNGDRWVYRRELAMRFENRERAFHYLARNARDM
jgi:hypothetical protein